MSIGKRLLGVLAVLCLLSGCTRHFVPDPSTFKLDAIQEFSSANSIALVNDQASSDDVLYMTSIGGDIYTNLHAWTEAAIAIMKRELSKRGMKVTDKASRQLKLSTLSVLGTSAFAFLRAETTLRVETADGYVNAYRGDNSSPAIVFRAADGAVMRAVAAMLRDEKIIEYLTR